MPWPQSLTTDYPPLTLNYCFTHINGYTMYIPLYKPIISHWFLLFTHIILINHWFTIDYYQTLINHWLSTMIKPLTIINHSLMALCYPHDISHSGYPPLTIDNPPFSTIDHSLSIKKTSLTIVYPWINHHSPSFTIINLIIDYPSLTINPPLSTINIGDIQSSNGLTIDEPLINHW